MLSWIYRKVFGETLAQRQHRKLGEIDTERAKLHNVEDRPILNRDKDGSYIIPKVMGFVEPPRKKGKKKSRHR